MLILFVTFLRMKAQMDLNIEKRDLYHQKVVIEILNFVELNSFAICFCVRN